jgi:acetylornithine deacetylase/succinyl-diaminopimelate desuccinylase family protein
MVTADELERIASTVDDHSEDALSFLQRMIRTPSVNPPGDYAAVVDLVEAEIESYGWDVELVCADEEFLAARDIQHPRPNVLGYAARGDGPTIVLNAHYDTVPVDESLWSVDPFGGERREGRVWGRGARDSKGRIATYALALRALSDAVGVPDDSTVVLAATADEETGGEAGAGYVVDHGGLDADYAIVEGSTYAIEYASAGVLHFEVTVTGSSSHAGIAPDEGANALLGAARILVELASYAERLSGLDSDVPGVGGPTCTPATVEGGTKTNVVPSSCSFTVDRRVPPDADVDDAEREFRDVVAGVDIPAGTDARVDVELRAAPFRASPDDVHVRAMKRNADAVFGRDVPLRGTRGFSDARFFAAGGAKTLKFGPGDESSNVHGPDENIVVDQIADAATAIAATVLDVAREG